MLEIEFQIIKILLLNGPEIILENNYKNKKIRIVLKYSTLFFKIYKAKLWNIWYNIFKKVFIQK